MIGPSRAQFKRTALKGYTSITVLAALAVVTGSAAVLLTTGWPQLTELIWPVGIIVLTIAALLAYHLLQLQSRIEVSESEVRLVRLYGTKSVRRSVITGIACRDVRGMVQSWRYAILHDTEQSRLLVLDRAYWSNDSLRHLAELLGCAISLESEQRTVRSLRREFRRR